MVEVAWGFPVGTRLPMPLVFYSGYGARRGLYYWRAGCSSEVADGVLELEVAGGGAAVVDGCAAQEGVAARVDRGQRERVGGRGVVGAAVADQGAREAVADVVGGDHA